MKRHVISALLGLALCLATATATATAAPPLTITDSGFYLTIVGADGVPELTELKTVIDLRTGSTPPGPETPTPPPEEPPPPLDPPPPGIAEDAAEWADEIGDTFGAQRYALIFEATRDAIAGGEIEVPETYRVLRTAADRHLPDAWDPFRERLSVYFTEKRAAGLLDTPEQMDRTLELIRYGLEYSADGSESLPIGDAAAVVRTVNELIGQENKL